MASIFLECAIRAALIVAGTAVVLFAFRVKTPAAKHRIWTAVLLLMLLLPVWTVWGPKAPIRVLPPSTDRNVSEFIPPTGTPSATALPPDFSALKTPELPSRPPASKLRAFLLGVYLLGFFLLLARLAVGTVKAQKLIRQCSLRGGRYTSAACAAPVTVGWLHPTVILPEGWHQWPQAQLDAVLTHECEHARRRDPLIQWLALLNRAVFWFHPAAWWLDRELSSLAEEACDSAVLVRGYDAHDYAETLLDMARTVGHSGGRVNVIGMAMPGASLPQRIRQIIENVPSPRVSRKKMVCVAAACTITCAAFAAGTPDRAQTRAAQSPAMPDWQVAAGGSAHFDVASVKQDTATPGPQTTHSNIVLNVGDTFTPTGGLLSMTNYPLMAYITFAYKDNGKAIRAVQQQFPGWAKTNRYDIIARASANTTKDQFRLMMQALLADRFKFAMHTETRQEQIFAMVLDKPGKLGPQLQQHTDPSDCSPANPYSLGGPAPTVGGPGYPASCGTILMGDGRSGPLKPVHPGQFRMGARNLPLTRLATWLRDSQECSSDRPVADETGLNGLFDFVFEYTRPAPPPGPRIDGPTNPIEPDADGPSCLEALKKQLGLKLIPEKGPVDYFVVDHVEEPTPN